MTKVLVIGSGGREHVLVWKIAQSPLVNRVFCAPGNAGIAEIAECVSIPVDDLERLRGFAVANNIALTVVGPELPLTLGIVDYFEEAGLKIFGPTKRAAELEGSKVFAKDLMKRYGIPTASYKVFNTLKEAQGYAEKSGYPIVIKADGLAGGKGVVVCYDRKDALKTLEMIMKEKVFGEAGGSVVIEECLKGEEASFIVVTDAKDFIAFPSSQDHKALYDGDKGPNTGGMGAYSPAPVVTQTIEREAIDTIIIPTIRALEKEGRPYRGFLYAGLMITDNGPKVLEFNCRMGDPEAQPLLMRMKGDIVELFMSSLEGRLKGYAIEWDERASVCVVMASKGYPGDYEKGYEIKGLEDVAGMGDTAVFHAGTAVKNGRLVTAGGRVLGVTSLGRDIKEAIERAYTAVDRISWHGVHYRRDIGAKALKMEN